MLGAAALAAPLLLPLAAAASNKRIAIIVEPGDGATQSDIDRLEARIGAGLLRNRVTLVTRQRLGAVLQEQGFSNSNYADPETAASLGRIIGAGYILWAKLSVDLGDQQGTFVTKVTADVSADFELINVSTARITSTGTADGSNDDDSAAGGNVGNLTLLRRSAIDACAEDLVSQVQL
jgi:peptidoglycan-synthase activator LpoB